MLIEEDANRASQETVGCLLGKGLTHSSMEVVDHNLTAATVRTIRTPLLECCPTPTTFEDLRLHAPKEKPRPHLTHTLPTARLAVHEASRWTHLQYPRSLPA